MSAEENKALAQRYVDLWNGVDLASADAIVGPEFRSRTALQADALPSGPENLRQRVAGVRAAFPDARFTIETAVAEGEYVAVRWSTRARQQGEFRGVPPTGRTVTWAGMSLYRVADGKIADEWIYDNHVSLMQQLGAMAPPSQSGR
jgi:steroid delta-isomerase-like uncharacterized protein